MREDLVEALFAQHTAISSHNIMIVAKYHATTSELTKSQCLPGCLCHMTFNFTPSFRFDQRDALSVEKYRVKSSRDILLPGASFCVVLQLPRESVSFIILFPSFFSPHPWPLMGAGIRRRDVVEFRRLLWNARLYATVVNTNILTN